MVKPISAASIRLKEKLDNIAMERFGEFDYNACNSREQMEILKQLSNEEN